MEGVTYKPGGIVILQMQLNPTFAEIEDIISFDVNNFMLVTKQLITERFNCHQNAYEVTYDMAEYVITSHEKLIDVSVYSIYKKMKHILYHLSII